MAFQTSCAAARGINCPPDIVADGEGRELVQHGSALFPIACYAEDVKSYSVAWHWHEEFEFILAVKGPLTVDVNKTQLVLRTGQGVFINSGVLHAVEQAESGNALLHSGVFHPRLVGGMDTIFWQKRIRPLLQPGQGVFINSGVLHAVEQAESGNALLHSGVFHPRLVGGMDTIFWQKRIRPLLQPGAPAFFLLDSGTAWQREALACLQDAWQAVADEPPDYENEARYRLTTVLRLLGAQCEEGGVKVSQQEQIAAERMKQMLRFVEEHYAEELTVERIAACVALSESACLRSFRQLLGITPIQYVKQFRVEKAAELLRSTRLRTGEIGAECGFTDGSYFIKTFRELKHCTPKEYRQRFEA